MPIHIDKEIYTDVNLTKRFPAIISIKAWFRRIYRHLLLCILTCVPQAVRHTFRIIYISVSLWHFDFWEQPSLGCHPLSMSIHALSRLFTEHLWRTEHLLDALQNYVSISRLRNALSLHSVSNNAFKFRAKVYCRNTCRCPFRGR